MVIKATLFVLIILLFAVITLSCYTSEEGFRGYNGMDKNKKYNLYVNRFGDPTAAPRCLKTLADNKIGTWDCVPNDPTQIWYLNDKGNLMTSDPVYNGMCVQYNKDDTLSLTTCTINSTKFKYEDNQLKIQGTDRCVNLRGGLYNNGSIVDAVVCMKARADTVTWFLNPAPQTEAEKVAAEEAAKKKKEEAAAAAAVKKAEDDMKKAERERKQKEKEEREKQILAALTTLAAGAAGSVPQNNQVTAENQLSETGANAMDLQDKMGMLKNIQKMVRNELIASRSTDCMLPDSMDVMTDSCAQGKEYEKSNYKDTTGKDTTIKGANGSCPPQPNMSEYIKKDKIPCWGCSLDY